MCFLLFEKKGVDNFIFYEKKKVLVEFVFINYMHNLTSHINVYILNWWAILSGLNVLYNLSITFN